MTKVILNGSPVHYRYNMISYDDIVKFTLEDMREDAIYTVTYSKGLLNGHGYILPWNVIPIVDDMIINAVITGNG